MGNCLMPAEASTTQTLLRKARDTYDADPASPLPALGCAYAAVFVGTTFDAICLIGKAAHRISPFSTLETEEDRDANFVVRTFIHIKWSCTTLAQAVQIVAFAMLFGPAYLTVATFESIFCDRVTIYKGAIDKNDWAKDRHDPAEQYKAKAESFKAKAEFYEAKFEDEKKKRIATEETLTTTRAHYVKAKEELKQAPKSQRSDTTNEAAGEEATNDFEDSEDYTDSPLAPSPKKSSTKEGTPPTGTAPASTETTEPEESSKVPPQAPKSHSVATQSEVATEDTTKLVNTQPQKQTEVQKLKTMKAEFEEKRETTQYPTPEDKQTPQVLQVVIDAAQKEQAKLDANPSSENETHTNASSQQPVATESEKAETKEGESSSTNNAAPAPTVTGESGKAEASSTTPPTTPPQSKRESELQELEKTPVSPITKKTQAEPAIENGKKNLTNCKSIIGPNGRMANFLQMIMKRSDEETQNKATEIVDKAKERVQPLIDLFENTIGIDNLNPTIFRNTCVYKGNKIEVRTALRYTATELETLNKEVHDLWKLANITPSTASITGNTASQKASTFISQKQLFS